MTTMMTMMPVMTMMILHLKSAEHRDDDGSYDNYHRSTPCITKAADDCHDNYHRSIVCITKGA